MYTLATGVCLKEVANGVLQIAVVGPLSDFHGSYNPLLNPHVHPNTICVRCPLSRARVPCADLAPHSPKTTSVNTKLACVSSLDAFGADFGRTLERLLKDC